MRASGLVSTRADPLPWLSDYFNLDPKDVDWAARWNVAPTQEVAAIRQDGSTPRRKFGLMRWGLIPYWAKEAPSA
jgi:putative SOS response-associated peptidase YedK